MEASNSVFRNTIMQYLYVGARYVFPLLTLPYLARVFGPDTYGIRAYIVSLALFFQALADFGFNLSGAKSIIVADGNQQEQNLIYSAILSSKAILVLLLLGPLVAISLMTPLTHDVIHLVLIAYLGVIFNSFIPDFLFIGYEKMEIITSRYVLAKTITTCMIFLLIHSQADILLSIAIDSGGTLLALLFSLLQAKQQFNTKFTTSGVNAIIKSFRLATPFFLNNISVAALNALATVFVGLFLENAVSVAYWSLSVTALNAVLSLYNPVANALYPHMVNKKDYRLYMKYFMLGTVLSLIGAIAFALLAPFIMFVLGGDEYSSGSSVLVWLAPTVFFAYPSLLLGNPILGALGCEKEMAQASIISVLVYVCLIILINALGFFSLETIAVCRGLAELLLLIIRYAMVHRNIGSIYRLAHETNLES